MKSFILSIAFAVMFSGLSFAGVLESNVVDNSPQAQVTAIKRMNFQEYNRRVMFVKRGYDLVWNNRNATPEQIIEAMGTDAVAMFTNHGNEQIALATLAGQNGLTYTPLAVPAEYTLTPNQDGSISVVKVEPIVEEPAVEEENP
jgi:hypothetical protein